MQFITRYKWLIGGAGLAVLLVGFLLFRPDKLFIDDTVDESLADAFSTEEVAALADTTTTDDPETDESMDEEDSRITAAPQTTTTTGATSTTEAAGPLALTVGDFFGIDHTAEGTATIYELNGEQVLRFEDDTDIQNGPDLHVWLLASDDYDEQSIPTDYLYLGNLKGNIGGQNYELPAEFDPDVHRYVLVWCERFDVPFAAAPLT